MSSVITAADVPLSSVPGLDSFPDSTELATRLSGNPVFVSGLRQAVHSFVNSSVVELPATAAVGNRPNRNINSPDYFWLYDSSGGDTNVEREGFAAPAFANIYRVQSGPDMGLVHVDLSTDPADPGIVTSMPIFHPDYDQPREFPDRYVYTYLINIQVHPIITATSVSEAVELYQRIKLAFPAFTLRFEVNIPKDPHVCPDPCPCINCICDTCPCTIDCGCPECTCTYICNCPPCTCPMSPCTCGGSIVVFAANNPVAFGQLGYVGEHHTGPQVTYNGGAPPDFVHMPVMTANDSHGNMGGDAFRGWVRDQAQNSANASTNALSVPGGATIMRRNDGWISINGGNYQAPPGNGQSLSITGNWPGVTLVGDFTGINVFVRNDVPLTLGSATQAFTVRNTPAAQRSIATNGSVTVNVTDGTTMEHVNIGAHNGAMTFVSHGNPNNVSMGARFISGNHMTGEIRVSGWNAAQIPQFYTHQTVNITMRGVNRTTGAEAAIPMGGLFQSIGGSHMGGVRVYNGGASFDGMFFANSSGTGSLINGNTNIVMPPRFPLNMPAMPRLQRWLEDQIAGANLPCTCNPQVIHSCTPCSGPPACPCPPPCGICIDPCICDTCPCNDCETNCMCCLCPPHVCPPFTPIPFPSSWATMPVQPDLTLSTTDTQLFWGGWEIGLIP
jgi:hypothetical protein